MASAVMFSAILLLVAVIASNVSHLQGAGNRQPVSEVCLDCICQAVSGCNQDQQCEGNYCGLFHINRTYWADAGKPTLRGQSSDAPDAFPSCTIDPYCAALTVQGYMKKFAQDCNEDGFIDCNDYMAIHKNGGHRCVEDLPFHYLNDFNQCLFYKSTMGRYRNKNTHLQGAGNPQPVSEVCLGCICQAVSGCKPGQQCEGDHCGLFHITRIYWTDAGKPILHGQSSDAPDAFPSCTNDPYCAALTVQGYMKKFGQDCNGDGRVDCYDYMAIHKKGRYGCDGDLPFNYSIVFNQCIVDHPESKR